MLTKEKQAIVDRLLKESKQKIYKLNAEAIRRNNSNSKQAYKDIFGVWVYPMKALLWYVSAKMLVLMYIAMPTI